MNPSDELWQLYDEQAKPIPGQGATKDETFKGLLHGAAQIWIWRESPNGIEILVQKRAAGKRTWPNLLDISAAGHIDLGETPEVAAVREVKEELGIDIRAGDLNLVKLHRSRLTAPDDSIENEFKWVYVYELKTSVDFTLQTQEVDSVRWVNFDQFKPAVLKTSDYVPQGGDYYEALVGFFEKLR